MKETKLQKIERQRDEARVSELALIAFRATMPARLMKIQQSARDSGVNTNISLTANGPSVEFTRWNHDDRGNDFEETLTYDSDRVLVEWVENQLRFFKEEIEGRRARRKEAEFAWNSLPDYIKEAIKENIENLN